MVECLGGIPLWILGLGLERGSGSLRRRNTTDAGIIGTTILFIYGTLKRGQNAHGRLAGAQFLGEAVTQPCYRLYDLGPYPGLVEDSNGVAIRGELWAVDEALLRDLDEYEEAADLFVRRQALLAPPADSVEVYLFAGPLDSAIACGNYWPSAER